MALPYFATHPRRFYTPEALERVAKKKDAYLLDTHALCLTLRRVSRWKREGHLEFVVTDATTVKRLQECLMESEVMDN